MATAMIDERHLTASERRAYELVAEWCGPHVLIRHGDEAAVESQFLATVPHVPGHVLVLASSGAHRHTALPHSIRAVFHSLCSRPGVPGPRAVWLAVTDLGSPTSPALDWVRGLAAEFRVDVLAPHGTFTMVPGCGLYVGPALHAAGWRRFTADDPGSVFSLRYPVPSWESLLPRGPVAAEGLVAEPVPAGLAVRAERSAPLGVSEPAFRVPVDGRRPKLIVRGREPGVPQAAVAALLDRLPPEARSRLVVVPPPDRPSVQPAPVLPSPSGARPSAPGPGAPQAPAPGVAGPGGPQPVPRPVTAPPVVTVSAAPVPVVSGPVSRSVTDHMGASARTDGDKETDRATENPTDDARDKAAGENADKEPNRALETAAERTDRFFVPSPTPPSEPKPSTESTRRPATPTPVPAPKSEPQPERQQQQPQQQPEQQEQQQQQPEPLAQPEPEPMARGARATRTEPVVLADRPSTAAEQARLTASAGNAFTEALATVNAALSSWPSLRHCELAAAKVDYVAVCLYLGKGIGGAALFNETLRSGQPEPYDGYLACLASGLRRLPTHRRPVLRQGMLDTGGTCPYPVGSVLTEPSFLSASVALDVTVPQADLDVLIWPHSARRTSELAVGRSLEEAMFPTGRRFKALAVRTMDDHEVEATNGGIRFPGTAVLIRELAPGEDPTTADAVSRDRTVLSKLDRALAGRRRLTPRVLEDPDIALRLSSPVAVVAGQSALAAAVSAGMDMPGAMTTGTPISHDGSRREVLP